MSNSSIKLFRIDAFTSEIFKGNPACVMPLDSWLRDDLLLKIAKENNVSETAFFIKKDDHFYLRWFTPEIEMDLCGHATLATAYCLKKHLNYIGDSIMVVFGAPEKLKNHENNATLCAVKMKKMLLELNNEWDQKEIEYLLYFEGSQLLDALNYLSKHRKILYEILHR